ncbi:hypothetical protein [Bacillus toyonensis]|uniref:hypothetical protein n=1 Tax=Bacillus toyonensis TaxID=155322 RepID=UPI000BF34662|nr:hypothetical protein [Bacillus toyonensis]PGF05347.1 hypothetical protein COM61_02760 [Bacillus toyonensis]
MCNETKETTKEDTIKMLEEAKKLPVATLKDIPYIPSGISTEKLEEYLKDFAKPTGTCWACKKSLYLEWGLVHGIAFCTNCGMEVKKYHYFDNDKGKRVLVDVGLQYHPKNFSVEENNE